MTQTTKIRAKTGGEVGKNGEWYKGGQFLPSTTLAKLAPIETRKTGGKREVAPYVWEFRPADNLWSIYKMVQTFVKFEYNGTEITKMEAIDNPTAYNYYGVKREDIQILANLWNAGERWIYKDNVKDIHTGSQG